MLKRCSQLLKDSTLKSTQQGATPFRSFVEHLQRLDQSLSEAYWKSELPNFSGAQFPSTQNTHQIHANTVHHRQITLLPKEMEFTTSTLMRAAWSIIVARHSSCGQVVFGTTVNGRAAPLAGINNIIGSTIATVPIRTSVEKGQKIAEFLTVLQKQSADMLSHEQFGLQNMRRLNEGGERAHRIQSLLIVQLSPDAVDSSDVFAESRIFSENYMTYALTIECTLRCLEVAVEATFDKAVVNPVQMDRVLAQFIHVLKLLREHAASELRIGDLRVISPEDQIEIRRWNATSPQITYSSLSSLIERTATEHPSSLAVCAWDGELSYVERMKLSSLFVWQLIHHGMGPEVFVPILFRKSRWAIVAVLAIMKAGGAFLLLDLSHPLERPKQIVLSVDARMVICFPEDEQLGSSLGLQVVIGGEEVIQSLPPGVRPLPESFQPCNALYATFTSGSTGNAKGIVVENWNCASGFQAQVKAGLFTRDNRMLQFASASFDSAIEQMLCPLLAGGTVCIAHENDKLQRLAAVIREFRVNIADLTPSVAKLLVPSDVPDLQILRLSGEAVGEALVIRWHDHLRLENSYGPSECSVTSLVNNSLADGDNPSNIGYTVGCLAWIVESDDTEMLAPIGSVGELVIEGPIVARGYIKPVEDARNGFMLAPSWAKHYGERDARAADDIHRKRRFYRTGDLVRYEYDGSICYVGRNDSQVKLRGQRIELGEIERRSISHPEVSEIVILKANKGPYEGKLVALVQFVTFSSPYKLGDSLIEIAGEEIPGQLQANGDSLSQYLADHLPSFMIPAHWIALKSFPLSTTGKTDRKALDEWLGNISELEVEAIRLRSSFSADVQLLAATEETATKLSRFCARACARGDTQLEASIAGTMCPCNLPASTLSQSYIS